MEIGIIGTGHMGTAVAVPPHQPTPSGLELVSEVSDLAAGLGILTFTLAPLALPALALTALAAVPLLILALAGAMLAAPFLLARRLWRAHHQHARRTRRALRTRPGSAAGEARFAA